VEASGIDLQGKLTSPQLVRWLGW